MNQDGCLSGRKGRGANPVEVTPPVGSNPTPSAQIVADELRKFPHDIAAMKALFALVEERDRYWDALADIADDLPKPFRLDPQKAVDAFQKLARETLG